MTDASCWLTTDRLGLRRFTAADLDWLAELYCDHYRFSVEPIAGFGPT